MNKALYFLVLFLSCTVFAQEQHDYNRKIAAEITGTYLSDSENSCKFKLSLDAESNYLIKINDETINWGKVNFHHSDNSKDNFYISFGDSDLEALYKNESENENNTITFQNYGNSMNEYEYFSQCSEKYITLEKTQSSNEEAEFLVEIDGYGSISIKDLIAAEQSLHNFNFKFPDKNLFRDRILKVYGVDMDDINDDIYGNIITVSSIKTSDVIVRNKNYILTKEFTNVPQDFYLEGFDMTTDDYLYHYNNFIFYNDKASFEELEESRHYTPLYQLVVNHEYIENKELVKYIYGLLNRDGIVHLQEMIFTHNAKTDKLAFRKDMLIAVVEAVLEGKEERDFSPAYDRVPFSDEEDALLDSLYDVTEKVENNKSQYDHPDEILAYLYDAQLRVGVVGYIQSKLNNEPEYISFLKENNFFGLEKLEGYTKYLYVKPICGYAPRLGGYEVGHCFTNLDDGYVNLRKEPNGKSAVLATIPNGGCVILDYERFEEDKWVSANYRGEDCNDNINGYIHISQIKDED